MLATQEKLSQRFELKMPNPGPKKLAALTMAANCIGNPKDIPGRSLDALKTSDLLIFESDRIARKSLKAAGLFREYLKFSEHEETETLDAIRSHFKKGLTVCYMSDQGVPTLADPGKQILDLAYNHQVRIEVIPGPSSITAALAACPFLTEEFRYIGFLPQDSLKRRKQLDQLQQEQNCMVFLDTPYRRAALIQALCDSFGGERLALCALDISGAQENYRLSKLEKLKEDKPEKLNFVLVVEGVVNSRSKHREAVANKHPIKNSKQKTSRR